MTDNKTYKPLSMALGIGFTLLWIMMGAFSHQVIYANMVEFDGWAVTMMAAVVAFVALRFAHPRPGRALIDGPFPIVALLTASAGIIIVSIAINLPGSSPSLMTLGDIASGCGMAFALVQVREALLTVRSQASAEQACVIGITSAVLLYLLLLNVSLQLLIIVCAIAPAVSVALLRYASSDEPGEVGDSPRIGSQTRATLTPSARMLVPVAAPVVLLSLVAGAFLATTPTDSYATVGSSAIASSILALVFIAFALAAIMIKPRAGLRVGTVLACLTACISVAHVVVHATGPSLVSDSLRFLACFLYMLLALVEIDRLRVGVRTFCDLCVTIIAGLLVGSPLTTALPHPLLAQAVLAVAAAVAAIVGSRIAPEKIVRFSDGLESTLRPGPVASDAQSGRQQPGRVRTDTDGETQDENDYLHEIESRCRSAATHWHLSRREEEVLNMLVRGRSANSIAEDMGISYNTVKSHIAHIYAKTSSHTHEELMQVFEKL